MSIKKYIVPTISLNEHYNSWDELLDETIQDITTPLERLKTVMQKYTARIDDVDLFDLNVSNSAFRAADSIISITQSMGRAHRHGTADRIPVLINRYTPD